MINTLINNERKRGDEPDGIIMCAIAKERQRNWNNDKQNQLLPVGKMVS